MKLKNFVRLAVQNNIVRPHRVSNMKKIITLPRWTRITDLRFFSPMNASTKGRAMRVSRVSLPLTRETCLYSREKQKDTVCFVTFREPAYEACAFSIA